MLITVEEFIERVESSLDSLVEDLQDQTGRSGLEEAEAWRASFPAILPALRSMPDRAVQIHFDPRHDLALEYRLPASFSFADMVLLGTDGQRPSAVFVELKHWITRADQPGDFEGLMLRQGGVQLHPSDQVKGYVEYCRHFHSAVLAENARVDGCVWFTRDSLYDAYLMAPNEQLTQSYPCFSVSGSDLKERIPAFLGDRLTRPDREFARRFEEGRYVQDRSLVRALGEQILRSDSEDFVLLDNQRYAYNRCWEHVRRHVLDRKRTERCVIVVEGPPGSGKSVIAARLWASLVTNPGLGEGNVVLTTTSVAQYTSWAHLLEKTIEKRAARGAVQKANSYMPITTHEFGRLNRKYPGTFKGAEDWRQNLQILRDLGVPYRHEDQEMLISIVDEAHALINPESTEGRGQFGFTPQMGPQAFHIMRGSTICIFLLDSMQNFRERENTTVADLQVWAHELGAEMPEPVSLASAQFRCNGSKEYVDWVEGLLEGTNTGTLRRLRRIWEPTSELPLRPVAERRVAAPPSPYNGSVSVRPGQFDFGLFDSPVSLEDALRTRIDAGSTARFVASYAREWKTKSTKNPHALPGHLKDFNIPLGPAHSEATWSRVWNVIQNGDYSGFTQAALGSLIAEDPLCEVRCPYAVRGFDFDYVGLLWMSDLVWRESRWTVQPKHVHESGLRNLTNNVQEHSH